MSMLFFRKLRRFLWLPALASLGGCSKAVLLSKATATREVEQWEWCLQPGEVYPSQPDADGWSEQIYVFEGCLTLMVGDVPHKIAAGEFFMFASNQPHSYRNEGEVAVRFVRNVVI